LYIVLTDVPHYCFRDDGFGMDFYMKPRRLVHIQLFIYQILCYWQFLSMPGYSVLNREHDCQSMFWPPVGECNTGLGLVFPRDGKRNTHIVSGVLHEMQVFLYAGFCIICSVCHIA